MNKTKARRLTISPRTRLVGNILKTTGVIVFTIVWLYTFVTVFGQIITYYGLY
jgi:hypothetical protein